MSKQTQWGTSSWIKEGNEMETKSILAPAKITIVLDGQLVVKEFDTAGEAKLWLESVKPAKKKAYGRNYKNRR